MWETSAEWEEITRIGFCPKKDKEVREVPELAV